VKLSEVHLLAFEALRKVRILGDRQKRHSEPSRGVQKFCTPREGLQGHPLTYGTNKGDIEGALLSV
jgi:hypothetical protein